MQAGLTGEASPATAAATGGSAGTTGSTQAASPEAKTATLTQDGELPDRQAWNPPFQLVLGRYQREGLRQEDKAEQALGLRGDRLPASRVLRWYEGSQEVRDAAHSARQQTQIGWFGKRPAQVAAAAGFGANVNYDSPLMKSLAKDFRIGPFQAGAPLFLDVGAGVGYNTERLVNLGARVVANDQSFRQLAIMKRFLLEDQLSRIHLNDGDILCKSFPDGDLRRRPGLPSVPLPAAPVPEDAGAPAAPLAPPRWPAVHPMFQHQRTFRLLPARL